MNKTLTFMAASVFSVAISLTAQAQVSELQCENIGLDNVICFSDTPGVNSPVAATSKGIDTSVSMVKRDDLSGGALDIENQFEANTSLDDATEIDRALARTDRVSRPQLKIEDQMRSAEEYVKTLRALSVRGTGGRVSISGTTK